MNQNKKNRKLRVVQLAAIIFLTISGGPYGLEPILNSVGGNGALILLVLTPLLWDLPTIFIVLELNSMMPTTGGYYQWVKKAMGFRFAWYEGWWTWFYTFVDLAIYPVLFMEYLNYFYPNIEIYRLPICLGIIWFSALLNIRGIVTVGKASIVLGILVILPFIVLIIYYFLFYAPLTNIQAPAYGNVNFSLIGLGLYTVMWNFLGWDNVTTYADEVSTPIKTYLKSIFIAFISIFTIYFLIIYVSINSGIDYKILEENGFPVLGELLGNKILASFIAFGGLASGLGLYSSVLLSVSRIPRAMAEDKLLPSILVKLHPSYHTPFISIILCSIIVSFLVLLKFSDLVIMDVIIYGAALFLEFASLIILRIKFPDIPRPFKIPLNILGLIIMICLPIGVYFIALTSAIMNEKQTNLPFVFAIIILISGELIWRVIVWKNPIIKSNEVQQYN